MNRPLTSRLSELLVRLSGLYWLGKTQLFYRRSLGALGPRSRIIKPLQLRNLENIHIGTNVRIANYVWLLTLSGVENHRPRMVIGDGARIGHFNHITCVNHVEIGPKVLTADRVHISDHSHGFEDPSVPIVDQPVKSSGPVKIGFGTWLGENVSVLSCIIGRNCVVGANAVVTRDIPDYCVAVGVPAKVVRRYNPTEKKWERV